MIIINDVNSRTHELAEADALEAIPAGVEAFIILNRSFEKLEVDVNGADEAPIVAALTAKGWDVTVF